MNKARRQELKILKFKKRIKQLGLDINNLKGDYNTFKSSGTPCSCGICQDKKYRDGRNRKNYG